MTGPGTSPPVRERFSADTIDELRYQRVKVSFGKTGEATDTAVLSPMPTSDLVLHYILDQILLEGRLINLYLSRLTGEELAIDDIEDY